MSQSLTCKQRTCFVIRGNIPDKFDKNSIVRDDAEGGGGGGDGGTVVGVVGDRWNSGR